MTLTDAIATLRAAGAIERAEDRIRLRLPKKRPPHVEQALSVVHDHASEVIELLGPEPPSVRRSSGTLEEILKGQAIGLFCNELDQTLWLVADEEDARLVGERRGLVYTSEEIRLVASIGDPDIVRAVHAFKDEFDVAAKPSVVHQK